MDGNAVTSDDIKRYKASRQKAGAENATINRELAILRKAYTLALESTPPLVNAAPKISKLEENGAREGFVEAEQFQALVAAADELWLRAIVTIAYTFAFRRGELLGLKVNQIDLDRGTITLAAHSTKNKTARVVVMTNGVLELVSACVQDKGPGDYVFSRGRGPVKDFRGAWWNLCVKAGLGKFVEGKYEGLLFHDLRRSGVRNLVRAGVRVLPCGSLATRPGACSTAITSSPKRISAMRPQNWSAWNLLSLKLGLDKRLL
jgi:integrase